MPSLSAYVARSQRQSLTAHALTSPVSGSLILHLTSLASRMCEALGLQYTSCTSALPPGAIVPVGGSTLISSLLDGLRMSKLKAYGYLPAGRDTETDSGGQSRG